LGENNLIFDQGALQKLLPDEPGLNRSSRSTPSAALNFSQEMMGSFGTKYLMKLPRIRCSIGSAEESLNSLRWIASLFTRAGNTFDPSSQSVNSLRWRFNKGQIFRVCAKAGKLRNIK